jgi:hypothetical protein
MLFKAKYEQAREFGIEYFRGDAISMITDINRIVSRLLPSSKKAEHIASSKIAMVRTVSSGLNIFGQIDMRETVPMDVVE